MKIETSFPIIVFLLILVVVTPDMVSAQEMQLLGHWDFGPTFDVVVDENYMYLAAGEQVRIYDISTKEKLINITWQNEPYTGILTQFPEPLKILHTGSFVNGIYTGGMDGNYLYIN